MRRAAQSGTTRCSFGTIIATMGRAPTRDLLVENPTTAYVCVKLRLRNANPRTRT